MSTERIIVDEKVADAFVAKFATKASKLPAGDPRGDVVLGSLVDLAPAERMDILIADAVAKGAKVVAGGKRNGTVVEATLLDHVTAHMKIYGEESFGPVKSIIRVNGADEAVRIANDTEYGLSAAVFGRDITRAMAVARRIQSGICHINGPTVADEAQMPFGGVKSSGYGRFGGGKAVINESGLTCGGSPSKDLSIILFEKEIAAKTAATVRSSCTNRFRAAGKPLRSSFAPDRCALTAWRTGPRLAQGLLRGCHHWQENPCHVLGRDSTRTNGDVQGGNDLSSGTADRDGNGPAVPVQPPRPRWNYPLLRTTASSRSRVIASE